MMIEKYYWIKQLFWMLGKMYLSFLKFESADGIDIFYFILVHISYKGKLIGKRKISFLQQVKNFITALFGLAVTIALIWLIIKLFGLILKF